ncbi:hypothetical protein [Sinorhizobium meliloti]|uniref:hypothetical protein n=1 Tax=Rhizobium meliloti TaxID=382 RepID=UPI001F186D0F|nr:hypothetical protein [Sinorhizobium meliloti]
MRLIPIIPIAALALLTAPPAFADKQLCRAAAHRIVEFAKEEAKGTRHEAQIANAIKKKGEAYLINEMAGGLNPDQCAFLIIAPDSTVRAIARAAMPARSGK